MERFERRAVGRVSFPSKGIIVICDNQEVIPFAIRDLAPIGVGGIVEPDTPNLIGKDVILVAETLIMYADVVRQVLMEDGKYFIGLSARRFTGDVLQFLFDGIEMKAKLEEEEQS